MGLPPTPPASSPAVRRNMQANRRRDTTPELALRRLLHASGLRFRVDLPVRTGPGRAVRPDVVFTRRRLAVFVDGCFWHSCPEHGRRPTANAAWWEEKLGRNSDRDAQQQAALQAAGWEVLRFWEHEPPETAAAAVVIAYHR